MEWLSEILNFKNWMNPAHCVPLDWFRYLVWVAGAYIATLYSVFAYKALIDLKGAFDKLLVKGFSKSLGIVFLLCAITHIIHSTSYITQYVKPLLLISYPLLCFWHTKLLLVSSQAVEKMKTLKTPEQHRKTVNAKDKAENKVDELTEENAILKKLIAKSYAKKDFSSIKTYIENA